jgi:hypothetical protein
MIIDREREGVLVGKLQREWCGTELQLMGLYERKYGSSIVMSNHGSQSEGPM